MRTRIFLAFTAALAIGFGALAWWVAGDLRARYAESSEEILVDASRLLAQQLAGEWDQPADRRLAGLQAAIGRLGHERFSAPIYSLDKTSADIRVYVTDAAGRLLWDSSPGPQPGDDYSQWHDVAMTLRGQYGARTTAEPVTDEQGQTTTVGVAYVAAPIRVRGDLVGVVGIGKPKTNIQRFTESARRKFTAALAVAALAVVALALLLYAWVSRPLQQLTAWAQAVGEGRDQPLPALGSSEVARVGEAMERMRTALLGKQYVEGYVQSLTHELKSPLTAIRAHAELLGGELPAERRARFVATIEREVDRLASFADRLLELAALERADRLASVGDVSVHALVADVATAAAPVAAARGITLVQRLVGADRVRGDALLLRQAIDNLLRNALDFAPAGSEVGLAAEAGRSGVVVTVSDAGPGIPGYARERVFERFFSLPRPGGAPKSTGLGLTFVRQVAQLHRGHVELEGEGQGTRARLFIPWALAGA